MASQIGVPFHDQNFDVQHKGGASALLGKLNSGKQQKKAGGLGGRKPLGEISNSAKIVPSQAPKKSTVSKVSGKAQTRSRSALSDISNCGKAHLHEAPKNNQTLKLSTEKKEHDFPDCIEDEKFLHDHSKCIKAQSHSMDVEEFLALVGLSNASLKQVESPYPVKSSKKKTESSSFDMELFELPEDEFLWEQKLDSPFCMSPKSPSRETTFWGDCDIVNFELMESP